MKKLILLPLAGLLVLLLTASGADAAVTYSKLDPRGDQRTFGAGVTTRMKTSGDITRVTFTRTPTRVSIRFNVRDLALGSGEWAVYSVPFQVDYNGAFQSGRIVIRVYPGKTTVSYAGWRASSCTPTLAVSRSFADNYAAASFASTCMPGGKMSISPLSDVKNSRGGLVQDRGPDMRWYAVR